MDRSAQPCEDLYQYACGGWIKNNPIPADQASWDVYGKLAQDNQRFLWGILDGLAAKTNDRTGSQQKIGDYFAACMDESRVEADGASPLKPLFAAIDSIHTRAELAAELGALHLGVRNGSFLFAFASNPDFENASSVIAFADAGGLSLPDRDYYTDTDAEHQRIRQQYEAHVVQTFVLLGESAGAAKADAAAVVRIESALARASLTGVERRDPRKLFHKLDRQQLDKLTPRFDWGAYLASLDAASVKTVNVTEPEFFAALNRVLASTPLPALKSYLRWHVVTATAPYLSKAFAEGSFGFFSRTLRGVPEQRPRWKRCVALVDAQLGEALGQEFVARAFPPELRVATMRMTAQIEQAMHDDILQLPWMSPATKVQAIAKLEAINNKIGYPDTWRDYATVEVRRDDFFGNVVRAARFESARTLAKIGKPLERGEWQMTPPTVNAYYDAQMNDINFPAGVLQPPLYDARMDDAPNYGDTGATIGHELTHGFDDEGRQFDAAGNLKDWWSAVDSDRFNERSQCIVDQYAKYVVVDDIHINSKLTLGEDIADLGGIILAEFAWRAQTAGKTLKDQDGLTPEQRFFVGYAQWAC
jgi:endothelin-converting enzyme/putative endopeptidase